MERKVLIVDDSRTLAKMLSYLLKELGYSPDVCLDPKEGLYKISKVSYNLVFLDLEMPEINGVQFLKKLQTSGVNVPIVILTARDDSRLVVGIMSQFSNVKKYLTKPYTKDQIQNLLKEIVC